MPDLPTRYFVQTSQSDSTYGPPEGWRTIIVTFDRELAESYAKDFERAALFEEGENVSELVSTIARVITAGELRAISEEMLAQAENATRVQFQQIVAAWEKSQTDRGQQ